MSPKGQTDGHRLRLLVSPAEHHRPVSDVKKFPQNPPTDFESAFLGNRGHKVLVNINFCSSSRNDCREGGRHFSDLLNDLEELCVIVPRGQGGGLQDRPEDHKDKQQRHWGYSSRHCGQSWWSLMKAGDDRQAGVFRRRGVRSDWGGEVGVFTTLAQVCCQRRGEFHQTLPPHHDRAAKRGTLAYLSEKNDTFLFKEKCIQMSSLRQQRKGEYLLMLKIRVKSHLEFSMFAAHSWPRQSCTSHQPSHADTDTRDRDTFNILLTLIIFP